METLFYFWELKEEKKTSAIDDPIMIDESYLSNLDEYSLERLFENNKLKLKNIY